MAKKNDVKFNYAECLGKLRKDGAGRLYLIWGAEDYLSEQLFSEIKKLCLGDNDDDFSYRKLSERDFSAVSLSEAIDSVPFLSDKTLVEVRNVDLNRVQDSDSVLKAITDIPDYCTVVFINDPTFEPDKRLKLIKTILKDGEEIHTTAQSGNALINWIVRRFGAGGKRIELSAAQRLITVSGDLMNRLIPEIDKLIAYTKGDTVTVSDVNSVAHHIPDAVVFDMTERIALGDYNAAITLLGELLSDKNNEPIALLAALGNQMRRLYVARVAIDSGKGADYLMRVCAIKHDFIAGKLMASARKLTTAQTARAVELCTETDYRMKSSGEEPAQLLKECVLRIAAGEENA